MSVGSVHAETGAGTQPTGTGLSEAPLHKGESWEHQKRAYRFVADLWKKGQAGAGLFLEMGCGKSRVAIQLRDNFTCPRTLILCPKSVMTVWPDEIKRHSAYEEVDPLVVLVPEGTKKERARQIREQLSTMRPSDDLVVILNYDVAWAEPIRTVLLDTRWDLVILDEAHRAKAPGGKLSRFVALLGKKTPKKLALTGTPLPHSPLDAYGLYRFLNPSIFGFNYVDFRDRYAVMSHTTPPFPVGYQNLEELQEKMYRIAIRVKKEEALTLPAVTHVERSCALGRVASRAYADLEEELYAKLENGEVTAANSLVLLIRLRQITGGFLKDDAGAAVFIDDTKESLLEETIEDLPPSEPIVVFAVFHHELDTVRRVAEKQKRRYAELSGRRSDLALWQEGGADVIGVQIQAGGVGISLVRAAYAIYYSVSFSLAEFEQSMARLHRPGQTRPVTFYHLLAKDTVDLSVYEALRARKSVVESVLNRFEELVSL